MLPADSRDSVRPFMICVTIQHTTETRSTQRRYVKKSRENDKSNRILVHGFMLFSWRYLNVHTLYSLCLRGE